MNLCWVTIKVLDMDKSLAFYQQTLGLSLNNRVEIGGGHELAFLNAGTVQLELSSSPETKNIDLGQDISIGLEVDSVEKWMNDLKDKEVEVISDIVSPNPSIKFFLIKDLNGLTIQFVENIK